LSTGTSHQSGYRLQEKVGRVLAKQMHTQWASSVSSAKSIR